MKPGYLILGAFFAACMVLVFAVYQYEVPMPTLASTSQTSEAASTTASYTLTQVAQHGSSTSCWSTINGKVYDLTNWIDQHPGGPEHILAICGKDGSSDFNQQHGGDAQVESILQQFYIGTLKKS